MGLSFGLTISVGYFRPILPKVYAVHWRENSVEGLSRKIEVSTGNSYCSEDDLKEIMNTIHGSPNVTRVTVKIQSDVVKYERMQ